MGEETARLRAEIDQTRDDLTRDVDLLAEKTSPSKIVERRVERTKRGISGIKDKVMGTFGSDDDDEYGYGTTYSSSSGGGVSGAASSAKDSVTGAASLFPRELLEYALPFPPRQFAHFHDHWVALTARSCRTPGGTRAATTTRTCCRCSWRTR